MNGRTHWLVRPETIRLLWRVFIAILVLSVLAQIFVAMHPHFSAEGIFGFYASYGFVACVAMVMVAKWLGRLIKRRDDYYEGGES